MRQDAQWGLPWKWIISTRSLKKEVMNVGKWYHRSVLREQACEAYGDKVLYKNPRYIYKLEILDPSNPFLLFHHAFRAL
jgi:hypothetical protein